SNHLRVYFTTSTANYDKGEFVSVTVINENRFVSKVITSIDNKVVRLAKDSFHRFRRDKTLMSYNFAIGVNLLNSLFHDINFELTHCGNESVGLAIDICYTQIIKIY